MKRQFGCQTGIELAFVNWAVEAQVSRAMRRHRLGAGGLNSTKHSNPRHQDQNLTTLVGKRTRVRFRVPSTSAVVPTRGNFHNETVYTAPWRFTTPVLFLPEYEAYNGFSNPAFKSLGFLLSDISRRYKNRAST